MKYNIFHFDLEKGSKYPSFPLSPPQALSIQNLILNSPDHITNNPLSTTDTENSFKNYTEIDAKASSVSVIKDKFIKLLFDVYSENNCLCNYLLFEKNVDIFSKFNSIKNLKRITLDGYFEIFMQYETLGLNIPYIDDEYKIRHNTFNPTLSSMILLIKPKSQKKYKTYSNMLYSQNNISLKSLKDGTIKIEFKESNPHYNRDTMNSKLDSIHKLLAKKEILLNDIIKEGSYFSILWSGSNYININNSFLSFYTFDFNYIGSLIMKKNSYNWLSCFSIDENNYKNFKSDYFDKRKKIESFLESCMKINLKEIVKDDIYNYFAYDYIKYCYDL